MKNTAKIIKLISFIIIILRLNVALAFSASGFEENNGQIIDEFGSIRNDVLFISRINDCKILLTTKGISYQFERPTDKIQINKNAKISYKSLKNFNAEDLIDSETLFKINRVDIEFLGSKSPMIIKKGISKDFNKYIKAKIPEPEQIITNSYDTVIFKDLYDGVDVVFYSAINKNNSVFFKYDFIIHPAGDINSIKMKFNGAKDIEIENNELIVKTGDITFKESIPMSFLSNGKTVDCKYELNGNELSFLKNNIEKNNEKSLALTIDPYFIYSSYYGGSNEDVGMEIATDKDGNYYIGGYTSSTSNIATSGAYQTEMRGEKDAFVIKFNGSGVRQWCTYFGGSSFDFGHTLDCDKEGNIYLGGWTQTKSGMATLGSFQYFYGGGEFDAFIVKFSTNGNLLWSTYFGGQFEDYINDLVIDGSGDIVFTGRTASSTNIATAGAFQTEFAGNYDMFLQKFTPDGYRFWGTFYGGEGFDVGMEVTTDIFNNIIFAGFTQSRNNIASAGVYKDSLSGIWDAFISKFDKDGKRFWGTYYGGDSEDNSWGIASDGNGDIFVTGHTASSNGISTPGAHKRYLTNDELDGFISKFNKSGQLLWGTYFGGDGEEYGNCGVIDAWGNFIISGNTMSDSGVVTNDAPQLNRSSQRDAFLAKFNSNGQRIFGTYYGGAGNDYGHGVVSDYEGRILMTGYSFSTNLFTTLDAQQSSFAGVTDAYVLKLGDAMLGDSIFTADFTDTLCADSDILIPFTVNEQFATGNIFIAQLSDMKGVFREYYNIGTLNSTNSGTITCRIPREVLSGTNYRIRVVGTSPEVIGDDNEYDITLFQLPEALINGPEKVCEFQEARYRTIQADDLQYSWSITGGIITSSTLMSEVDVLWGESSNASLKVVVTNITTGCVDSAEYLVTIYPALRASSINGPQYVCPNNEYLYFSTREEGIENKWEVTGGTIIGDSTGDNLMVFWKEPNVGEDKTGFLRLIQTVISSGCKDTSEKVIYKRELPKPFIVGDSISTSNSVKTYRTISSSKYSYFWSAEGGMIEAGANSNQCYVRWLNAGKGSICLHLKDKETDCEDSVKMEIIIRDDAAKVISGNKKVCGNSIELYSVNDTLYTYIWRVTGGQLSKNSDSTATRIEVIWQISDTQKQGCLFLFRENKNTKLKDTLVLDIEILSTPMFNMSGNNVVCEGVISIYKSDKSENSINTWQVSNGKIFGDIKTDSIIVFWERKENDDSPFRLGKVELTKTDTTSFCATYKYLDVRINKTEKADFEGDTLACENSLKIYSSKSKAGSNLIYNWHIAGGVIVDNSGDTSIIVKWGKQGKAYVQLISLAINQCSDSLMRTVTIAKSPEKPIITQSGKTLISSADEGNQWYIGGEKIVGATAKEYTPDKSGLYTVRVTNSNGCESEFSSPFNFDISNVNDNYYQNDIVFFPNPVDDVLSIKINLLNYSNIKIKLCDLFGKELFSGTYSEDLVRIDMSSFAQGVYILKVGYLTFESFKVLKY